MRILHLLSQRPEATGSGIFIQAMLREAVRKGHANYLVAGIPDDCPPAPDLLSGVPHRFVRFGTGALPFPVVGMSDVMPYDSTRFCDLDSESEVPSRSIDQSTAHAESPYRSWPASESSLAVARDCPTREGR